jgi:hypothetical protein
MNISSNLSGSYGRRQTIPLWMPGERLRLAPITWTAKTARGLRLFGTNTPLSSSEQFPDGTSDKMSFEL